MTRSSLTWALGRLIEHGHDYQTMDGLVQDAKVLEAAIDGAAADMLPRPVVVPSKAWVVVMASPEGLMAYWNGYAGGMPTCTTHIAGAIRLWSQQSAQWVIDCFPEGFSAHPQELDLE